MMSSRSLVWWCGLALGAACGDDGARESATEGAPTASMPTTPGTDASTAPPTEGSDPTTGSGSDSQSSTPTTTDATTTDATDATTAEPVCPADCMEEGGVCIAGECCPTEDRACGDTCCPDGGFCSFNTCVTPGSACIDASECGDEEYCEYSLGEPEMMGGMCQGGVTPATGKCLPAPPTCAEGQDPGDPPTCLSKCEYKPPPGAFSPVVKYHWDQGDVMMTPMIVQLDDDNCDQLVDEKDIPEIGFITFDNGDYVNNGTLHIISIVDGAIVEKWTYANPGDAINPGRELAGGNIDGVPGNEVLATTVKGNIVAFKADGSVLWTSAAAGSTVFVSIADLDQDGAPEVLTPSYVLDGKTGAVEVTLPGGYINTAADLDGDGQLDIVHSQGAYNAAGGVLATTGLEGVWSAVADLDGDGKAEVATIANGGALLKHHLIIWRHDPNAPSGAAIVRAGIDINGPLSPDLCPVGSAGNTVGGGPQTIADFNGDGTPDVAVAGGVGYAVFDGKKLMDPNVADADTFLWIKQTQDCSSAATGSSVFDFDGDGSAEVIYSDETTLRVYKGSDGAVLWSTCNTTGTLVEYPLVADVDGDGHADIIAVSNDYSGIVCDGTKQTGVRIFGDAQGSWVRTRRVWNQHTYHVTNTEESGEIPKVEATNWQVPRLNNFRQNVQPEGEFAAPDLIVDLRLQCAPEDYGLIGRVRNIGEASTPAGVPVYFYEGDPDMGGTLLGMTTTTKVLYPAEAEEVVVLLAAPPPGLLDGSSVVWVVVDDAMPTHSWHECRVDNNRAFGTGKCPKPPG